MGELVDVLEAVCLIDGVKPHDLAARLLFDHLREQKLDTDVATVIKAMRRLRGPKLHAVDGN